MMDGAVAFKIVLLAAIMAIPAMIIGAIWPYKATRWVVGLIYAVPAALATWYILPINEGMAAMVNEKPSGALAGGLLGATIGSFALGFMSARFGTGIRQDFAAVSADDTGGFREKRE